MQLLKTIIAFILTVGLVVSLNGKLGPMPPLGKFLSPFTGFWQNAATCENGPDIVDKLVGLENEVSVLIDEQQIPHVFAKNDEDLYFMQGYLTARDRLWQMEFIIYAASGRISELIGASAIKYDRTQRRLGITHAAKKTIKILDTDPVAKATLEAYAKGVNAYIQSLEYKSLPVEYKLMDYTPQKWTPYNSALLLKFMAKMLTAREYDFEYTNALKLLGKETFNLLYPDFPKGIEPIIPFDYNTKKEYGAASDSLIVLPETAWSYSPFEKPQPNLGSNNWAVSGEKSTTGSPILCNDPHLGNRIPCIWYQMQLVSPNVNVYGVSTPGAPGITIGFNNEIAWGVTNASMDVKDWYTIQFKDRSRNEYLLDGKWMPAEKIIEEIKVKNAATFYDTIITTHWGPVTYDGSFKSSNTELPVALKWTAHNPSNELKTFYLLNRAKNHADYLTALSYYECPGQNFVFASRSGDIAIKQQGKFPLKDRNQGKFVMDGTTTDGEWKGFIPFKDNPAIKNPQRGFVSSANQHPTDSTYPYYYNGIYEYNRNRRINEVLSSKDKFSPDDLKKLQTDNFNILARDVLPFLLKTLNVKELNEHQLSLFKKLENWNYFNEINLVGPTIFQAFWDELNEMLWDEFDQGNQQLVRPNYYITVDFLKNNANHKLVDNQSTKAVETLSELVNQAFQNATKQLNHWADSTHNELDWATFKGTRLEHWAKISPFNIKKILIGGNRHIINATSKTHGASWRMVVALGDEPKAWGIYPGGQSGNPGSPHYQNFVLTWAQGEYFPLLYLKDVNSTSEQITFSKKITPAQ